MVNLVSIESNSIKTYVGKSCSTPGSILFNTYKLHTLWSACDQLNINILKSICLFNDLLMKYIEYDYGNGGMNRGEL